MKNTLFVGVFAGVVAIIALFGAYIFGGIFTLVSHIPVAIKVIVTILFLAINTLTVFSSESKMWWKWTSVILSGAVLSFWADVELLALTESWKNCTMSRTIGICFAVIAIACEVVALIIEQKKNKQV